MVPSFFGALYGSMSYMMSAFSPQLLIAGRSMTLSVGTTLLIITGISMMFTSGAANDKLWTFVKVLFLVVIVNTLSRYYLTPESTIGYSLIGLIEKEADWVINVLDRRAIERVVGLLAEAGDKVPRPSVFSVLGTAEYIIFMAIIEAAQFASLIVISWGLVGEKLLVLVGPLVIWTLLVPPLQWVFWSWLKSLIAYSWMPIFAIAWVVVGERFLTNIFSQVPPNIWAGNFLPWIHYLGIMVLIYALSVFLIPSIAASMFSGGVETGSRMMLGLLGFAGRAARGGK